jgi:hypothetical protein
MPAAPLRVERGLILQLCNVTILSPADHGASLQINYK